MIRPQGRDMPIPFLPLSASSLCFSAIFADTGCQAWAPGMFVHRFWQPGEGVTPSPPDPCTSPPSLRHSDLHEDM